MKNLQAKFPVFLFYSQKKMGEKTGQKFALIRPTRMQECVYNLEQNQNNISLLLSIVHV